MLLINMLECSNYSRLDEVDKMLTERCRNAGWGFQGISERENPRSLPTRFSLIFPPAEIIRPLRAPVETAKAKALMGDLFM